MATLTLGLLLAVFIIITGILVWFSYRLVKQLLLVEEGVADLQYVVKNFYEHLGEVNKMETYHGEPVIQSLIDHSRQVILQVKKFETSYTIAEEDLQGEDIDESKNQ